MNFADNKSPAHYHIKLRAKKDKNDKGSYCVYTWELGKPSSQTEVDTAFKWMNIIRAGETRTQEQDETPVKTEVTY